MALNRLCDSNGKKEHIIQIAREAIEYAKKLELRVRELEAPFSSRSSESLPSDKCCVLNYRNVNKKV